jgi:hypothetical protein
VWPAASGPWAPAGLPGQAGPGILGGMEQQRDEYPDPPASPFRRDMVAIVLTLVVIGVLVACGGVFLLVTGQASD